MSGVPAVLTICPSCGSGNRDAAGACRRCGTALPPPPEGPPPSPRCPACGARAAIAGTLACPSCGLRLPAPEPAAPTPVPTPPLASERRRLLIAASALVVGGALAMVALRSSGPDLEVRWRLRTGAVLVDGPAVEGQSVHVATRAGSLVAADVTSGAARWRFETGEQVVSGPVVGGGLVYLATEAPVAGEGRLYAVDGRTGDERWRATLESPLGGRPALGGGNVYLSLGAGAVVAFDAVTGEQRWRQDITAESEPAAADDVVVVATPDGLTGLDPATGTERWTRPTTAQPQVAPVAAGRVMVADDGAGSVLGLNRIDGAERWRFPTEGILQPPAVSGRSVVVVTVEGLVALDGLTGEERWKEGGPAGGDGLQVAADPSTVAVSAGELSLLDASTGELRGRLDLTGNDGVAVAVAGGVAYVAHGDAVEAVGPAG